MNKFWKWAKAEAGSELILDGVIASESWWDDEITPKMFREELAQHPGAVTVRINSPGGDVFAGVAIYNYLAEHDGEVTVKVDGVAASIASLIAMAGDKIIMLPGAMMMVHQPWTFAAGNSDELQQVVESLKKTCESMVPIYTSRTGLSDDRVNELLKAETWMTGEDAVDLGFADEAVEAKASTISDSIKNAVSFAEASKAAVMQPVMSIKSRKANAPKGEEPNVPDANEDPNEDDSEEAKTPDETPKEEVDEDETSEEETPETTQETTTDDPVEEPVSDKQPSNSTKKEPKKMTKTEEIAKDQVIEPKKQAAVKQAKPEMKSYLKSNEAMDAFAQILEANASDTLGGKASDNVRSAWKEHLEVKMGVTNPEIFLPTPLIESIQNAFEDGGEIWSRVAKVGADVWNAAWDTEDDVNDNNGRGRGYNRADEPEKQEQVLTFDDRVLRPQFVYKYITLNKEDIKEQRSTGALVTYILSELPQRIVREVERAIVLGDGRASDNDFKIKEGDPRGFYPILSDADAENFFAGVVTLTGDESQAEAVAMALDLIETPGTAVLIAKKGYSTSARFAKDVDGRLLFPLGARATDVLGVDTIIEPDWFNDTNSPDYDAVVVVLSGYKVVGDTTIEGFSNFILKTNKQEYLQEIWSGGGLSQKKAAIAIPVATS